MDADTLREWREHQGMSQAELARRLDVRPATISDWERGARTMRTPRMLALALRALELEREHDRDEPAAEDQDDPD